MFLFASLLISKFLFISQLLLHLEIQCNFEHRVYIIKIYSQNESSVRHIYHWQNTA